MVQLATLFQGISFELRGNNYSFKHCPLSLESVQYVSNFNRKLGIPTPTHIIMGGQNHPSFSLSNSSAGASSSPPNWPPKGPPAIQNQQT